MTRAQSQPVLGTLTRSFGWLPPLLFGVTLLLAAILGFRNPPSSLIDVTGDELGAAASSATSATIVLPIEVFSKDKSVSFSVDPSRADRLYLRLHRGGWWEHGRGVKASIRLNGGAWYAMLNETVDVFEPERKLGGLGGAYHTVRLTIPFDRLGSLQADNTLEFHFHGPDKFSIGYRVVEFNVIASDGSRMLSTEYDDPGTWTPPLDAPQDIAEGRRLWQEKPCSKCHSSEATELWYFAFSDEALYEQAPRHNLTETEVKQIVSYIRSHTTTNGYAPPGRPWNPPYQPGPGLDSRPAVLWAAGAGIDWVLDSDKEVIPYMFPNGVKNANVSTKSTLNLREIPIDLQLPDWQMWMPRMNPREAWGAAYASHPIWQRYEELRTAVKGGNPASVERAITRLNIETQNLRNIRPAGMSDQDYANARLALQQWQLVRVWEAHRSFEDKAPIVYTHGEPRSWLGNARNVFDLAPHIINVNGVDNAPFQYGTRFKDNFMSHVWYQLQLILNAGNKRGSGQNPVDWNYQFMFLRGDPRPSGMRHVQTMVKLWQMRDNESGINTPSGWRVFDTRPSHIGRMFAPYMNYPTIWSEVDPATRREIAEFLLRIWLEKQLSYPLSAWPRGDGTDLYEPSSYVPKYPKDPLFRERDHADNFYSLAIILNEEGVDRELLRGLISWGKEMWPLGAWDDILSEIDPDSETSFHAVDLTEGWNLVSSYVEPSDRRMETVLAEALPAIVLVKGDEGNTFIPGYSNTIGDWSALDAYQIYARTATTISLKGRSLAREPSNVSLRAGWNFVPYLRSQEGPIVEVLSSIAPVLVLLVDESGRTYFPELGIDDVGRLEPGNGYRVYVKTSTTLVYPPEPSASAAYADPVSVAGHAAATQ